MTSVRILSNVRGELRPVFGFTECVVPFANHGISKCYSVESTCEPATLLMKHNGVPSLAFFNAPVASTSEASLPDLVGEPGTSEVTAATIVCGSGSWDDADAREVAVDLDSLGRYGSKNGMAPPAQAPSVEVSCEPNM